MPLEHEFFSPEQIAALYNLAKERGIPVDSMRFNEVIDYLYENKYTSIGMLLFSSAVFFSIDLKLMIMNQPFCSMERVCSGGKGSISSYHGLHIQGLRSISRRKIIASKRKKREMKDLSPPDGTVCRKTGIRNVRMTRGNGQKIFLAGAHGEGEKAHGAITVSGLSLRREQILTGDRG